VLRASRDAEVRATAARLLPVSSRRSSEGAPLPPIAELAARSGDAARGMAAFARACAACHQAGAVGPPLSAIGARLPKPALYEAILDPSASIAPGHEGFVVRTKDGRELTGMLLDATATEVAVMTAGGAVSRHPRSEVVMILPMDASLMPAGLETSFSEAELVDLVEYLSTLQAPSP
jgi:putative heme-binding domain-containing protein